MSRHHQAATDEQLAGVEHGALREPVSREAGGAGEIELVRVDGDLEVVTFQEVGRGVAGSLVVVGDVVRYRGRGVELDIGVGQIHPQDVGHLQFGKTASAGGVGADGMLDAFEDGNPGAERGGRRSREDRCQEQAEADPPGVTACGTETARGYRLAVAATVGLRDPPGEANGRCIGNHKRLSGPGCKLGYTHRSRSG